MTSWRERIRRQAFHHGLHGHPHISKQRRNALWMVRTAQIRVVLWAVLMVLGVVSQTFRHIYQAVFFVSEISLLALLLTDWGQYAASKSEVAALDAHHDVEYIRHTEYTDNRQLESDIAALAQLQPGPKAQALAAAIGARIRGEGV